MTHSYCLQQHQMYYKHLQNHLIRLQLYTTKEHVYGHLHSLTTEFTWLNPASMSHIRDPHHRAQRAWWSEQLREGFRTHKELNRPENLDPGLFYPDSGESGSSILIASLSTGLTPTTQEPNRFEPQSFTL